MPLEGEAKREYNREYYAAKKKVDDFAKVDESGIRYKAETFSYSKLFQIYKGEQELPVKKSKKKDDDDSLPPINPSTTPIFGKVQTFEEWLDLRDKARKDLFWLGKEVLRKDLVKETHQIVCDQLVQKNFDGCFPKGYTLGDVHRAIRKHQGTGPGQRERTLLLLDPRGFFKSTIDGIDCVQWMLNVVDIRILVITGEKTLAKAFLEEIKGYLFLPEGSEPSNLHLLFPEYVITKGSTATPFTLRVRQHKQKEKTIGVTSIDSNKAGWHCDIKKGDDIITENNCRTEETRKKRNAAYNSTRDLLDEWGFEDNFGTRYYPDDWYGERIKIMDKVPMRYFCRQCWNVKPEFQEVPLEDITEEMVILNFPEKATFSDLAQKRDSDPELFRCQQLNQPVLGLSESAYINTFTEEKLRLHLCQYSLVPSQGDIVMAVDTAMTDGRRSDFSCISVGKICLMPSGKYGLWVLKVIHDRWPQSETARQIVAAARQWEPKIVIIEKLAGSSLFIDAVNNQMLLQGFRFQPTWQRPDLNPNAKRNRIQSLETLLSEDRLWFVMDSSWNDDAFYQMLRYTGERKNKGRKDDIPDSLSFFTYAMPIGDGSTSDEDFKAMQEVQTERIKQRMQYDAIFGVGSPAATTPAIEEDSDDSNPIYRALKLLKRK